MKPSIPTSFNIRHFSKQLVAAGSVFVSRLQILPPNFSPLGSFGFFGNPWLFLFSIWLFDRFVGGTYAGNLITYFGFLMYPILGRLARNKIKIQVLLLPMASFSFFLISNAGVWWYWYDHSLAQLLLCYSLAVPFYARTLLGDLTFGYGYLALRFFATNKSHLLNGQFHKLATRTV